MWADPDLERELAQAMEDFERGDYGAHRGAARELRSDGGIAVARRVAHLSSTFRRP